MPVKKKTLLGTFKSSSQSNSSNPEPKVFATPASTGGVISMRRIVAKKLAVEKLIAAKRLS